MKARLATRAYRTGFLFTVALLAAVAALTLWTEVRSSAQADALTQEALSRASLIGTIRVNALSLESAVEAHIRATDEAERQAADTVMADILREIQRASEAYTYNLPSAERLQVWRRFNATCQGLAQQVRAAVKFSHHNDAEQARHHLVERIRPLAVQVDGLAGQLAQENAVESRQLINRLGALRVRSTALGAGLTLLAVALSLWVGRRLTQQLERQEGTIEAQLLELSRRNHELDAFASRVAHDLLSPLAPLNGYLTLIRRSDDLKDPQTLEMLGFVEGACNRMAHLIEALLRFCRAGSRADAGAGELDTAVSTLLLEVSQSAAAQGVALERHLESGLRVACPSQLLQLIAQNLLSNALKYSAGGASPRVSVRVVREGGDAVLEVSDNGRGMSEEVQASLFQPFFRAADVRNLPGHGLGLATTKRLVEAHQGRLHIRSAPGAGTQVEVRFALHREPVAIARAQ